MRVVEHDATNLIAGLCPYCLEVKCECSKAAKAERDLETAAKAAVLEVRKRASRPDTNRPDKLHTLKPKSGRGPTGRCRNFKAMSDVKLKAVYVKLLDEANDPEALGRAAGEMNRRGI